MFKQHFILLLSTLFTLVVCCFAPVCAIAQGTQTESFSLSVSDEQVENWLGSERNIEHPVIDNLQKKDEATLHFYFSKNYGQRAEAVIATAQSAREKTLRFLPPETVADVHVYLIGNINQYFDALKSNGKAPDWASGLTLMADHVILIRLASNGTTHIEPERTLAHELNHVALHRYSQDHFFPHWFYEGLAMTATDDWNIARAEVLGKAAMSGQLLDLHEIEQAFGKTGAVVDLAYSESAHFVSWLAKTYGDEAVRLLLKNVSDGMAFEQAFINSFDKSPNAAFIKWKTSVSREESLFASLFSHEGIFFMISVFAVIALCVALWKRTAIRKRRLAAMNQEIPDSVLPDNLKNFGPFRNSK